MRSTSKRKEHPRGFGPTCSYNAQPACLQSAYFAKTSLIERTLTIHHFIEDPAYLATSPVVKYLLRIFVVSQQELYKINCWEMSLQRNGIQSRPRNRSMFFVYSNNTFQARGMTTNHVLQNETGHF